MQRLILFIGAALTLLAQAASARPEQLHVSVHGENARSLVFFWTTSRRTKESCVDYRYKQWNRDVRSSKCADRDRQFRHGARRYDSPWMHEVTVDLLPLDTTISYRVGDGDGDWSQFFNIRTRPRDPDADVEFLAVGDQDTRRSTREVVERMTRMRKSYHFFLQAGDLSYADGNLEVWDKFGEIVEPAAARFPCIFALGNHEDDGRGIGFEPYLARWRNGERSENRYWWSVDFGPLHLVQVSSEHDFGSRSDQFRWLEKDLREANKEENRHERPWIIVTEHRPMYSSGAHGNNIRIREAVEPLLRRYGVQVVISGHDHNYERIFPVSNGRVTSKEKGRKTDPYITTVFNGENSDLDPIHVVAGTGGRGLRACRGQSWTASDGCIDSHGFLDVTANRRQITFKFIDERGRTKDEWKICSQKRCGRPPKLDSAAAIKAELDSSEDNSSEETSSDRESSGDGSTVGGGKGANNANKGRGNTTGSGAAKGNNMTTVEPNRWAAKAPGGAATGKSNTTAGKPSWGKANNGNAAKSGNRTSSGSASSNVNKWNKGQTYSWKGPSGKGANKNVTGTGVSINSESMQQAVSDHLQYEDAVSYQMDPRRISGIPELGDATACIMSFSLVFPGLQVGKDDTSSWVPKQSSFFSDYRSYMSEATRAEPGQVSIASFSPTGDGSTMVETVLLYLSNEESSAGEEVNEDLQDGLRNVFANDSSLLGTSSTFEARYGKSFLQDGSWSLNCAKPYKNSRDTPLPLDMPFNGHPQQSPAAAFWTANGAEEHRRGLTASSWIAIAAAAAASILIVIGATVTLTRCPRHWSNNGKRNPKDENCRAANAAAVMSTAQQAVKHDSV